MSGELLGLRLYDKFILGYGWDGVVKDGYVLLSDVEVLVPVKMKVSLGAIDWVEESEYSGFLCMKIRDYEGHSRSGCLFLKGDLSEW